MKHSGGAEAREPDIVGVEGSYLILNTVSVTTRMSEEA
jgi:hypothetical protein